MSRRRRAMLLVGAAAVAAGLGAALVNGYSTSVNESFGRLRPVVVVTTPVSRGQLISPKLAAERMEVRQVPVRFVPAGALGRLSDALGYETVGPLASGGYLTAGMLRRPRKRGVAEPVAGRGRVPVELTVSGAGALSKPGGMVDVLVTREGRTGGTGRTALAAEKVPLLALAGTDATAAGGGSSKVILGLSRAQAIRLIDAESFARRVTILPRSRR